MRSRSLLRALLAAAIGILSVVSSVSLPAAGAGKSTSAAGNSAIVQSPIHSHFRWFLEPSPNYGVASNVLESVSAVSPHDIWAVGISDVTTSGGRTLIEHSDGGAWELVDSPNVGTGSNILVGLAALSRKNAWAAGAYYSGSNQFTLIEHWNGSAWSVVPSPNPAPSVGGNALLAMSAVSSDDIWSVGAYNLGGGSLDSTMALHWNGNDWEIVPTPNNPGLNALSSVSARSSTDAWAVGLSASDWALNNLRPLAMHWNGTSWDLESVPMPPDATDAYLSGVSMGSHGHVWAVGTYKTSDGVFHALAMEWDGQAWTILPGFTLQGAVFTELRGVNVSKAGGVWAIGWGAPTMPPPIFNGPPEAYAGAETVILRWQNGSWERAVSPEPGVGSQLMGLDVLANRAWAVGNYVNDSNSPTQTLIAHYGAHMASAEAKSRLGPCCQAAK